MRAEYLKLFSLFKIQSESVLGKILFEVSINIGTAIMFLYNYWYAKQSCRLLKGPSLIPR